LNRSIRSVIVLIFGLLLGAGAGLYLGWVAYPIEYTDADPSLLADDAKREYAVMVATTYAIDGDLPKAKWHLATLGAEDVNAWYLALTVDTILANGNEGEIRYLVDLAHDLGISSPVMTPYLGESDG
jgi:hypothetical protein